MSWNIFLPKPSNAVGEFSQILQAGVESNSRCARVDQLKHADIALLDGGRFSESELQSFCLKAKQAGECKKPSGPTTG